MTFREAAGHVFSAHESPDDVISALWKHPTDQAFFMFLRQTRRTFSALTASALLFAGVPAVAKTASPASSREEAKLAAAHKAIAELAAKNGGRLGVYVRDTGSGRQISYHASELFAMCSTHKFLTAAAILSMVDKGKLQLNQPVYYTQADILSYAPVTKAHVQQGFMAITDLCAAAIEWSDNTAANLLLKLIGGPAGWTQFARSLGDHVSRLDRIEPSLNEATPGDPRDTTAPESMAEDLNTVLLGPVLTPSSRQLLEGWMLDNQITNSLLRAGMPTGWRVADKSGSGENGTRNDIGLILPPAPRLPIIATVFYTDSPQDAAGRDALIAQVGQIIAATFT